MTNVSPGTAFSPEERALSLPLFQFVEKGVLERLLPEFEDIFFGACETFARRCIGVCQMLREVGTSEEEVQKVDEQLETFLRFPSHFVHPSQNVGFLKYGVQSVTRAVTIAWIVALKSAANVHGDLAWLRADVLDESLLPRNDAASLGVFSGMLEINARGAVNVNDAREMLASARLQLPAGKAIPEGLEAFLRHCAVTLAV